MHVHIHIYIYVSVSVSVCEYVLMCLSVHACFCACVCVYPYTPANGQLSAVIDGYFSPESKLNICYCQACHEARGEKRYSVSGDPPCRYALPLGWCQFALR